MLLTYLFCDSDSIRQSRYFPQTILGNWEIRYFSWNFFPFSSLEGSEVAGCLINLGSNHRVFSGGEREKISRESRGRLKND